MLVTSSLVGVAEKLFVDFLSELYGEGELSDWCAFLLLLIDEYVAISSISSLCCGDFPVFSPSTCMKRGMSSETSSVSSQPCWSVVPNTHCKAIARHLVSVAI